MLLLYNELMIVSVKGFKQANTTKEQRKQGIWYAIEVTCKAGLSADNYGYISPFKLLPI